MSSPSFQINIANQMTGTAIAAALVALSSTQLAALASAVAQAIPPATLANILVAMIQTLPTDASAAGPTLWSNGGVPTYS